MFRWLLSTSVLAVVLFPAIACSSAARADEPLSDAAPLSAKAESSLKKHAVLGITFEAPPEFSEVQRLERDTLGIVYQGATPNSQMVVRFAEVPINPGWVQFSPSERMTYARYLFLGNNNAPSPEFSQRQFFGKTILGEAQTVRSRTGFRYIEMYIVPLEKSNRQLAIAFESDTLLSLSTVETAIDSVTQSMYELNKAELKALKKQQKEERKAQEKFEP